MTIHERPPADLLAGFAAATAAGLAAVVAAGWTLGLATYELTLAGTGFVAVALLVLALMRDHYPHRRIGACNLVTLIRAALVCALLAALIQGHGVGWPVAAVAGLALALDGIDGWLARRAGLASRFGARFDIEVDSALALVLALHALAGTAVGAEVLVLGAMRYAYVAAGWVLPWLQGDLPASQRRRAVCVIQLSALIALQTPLIGPDAAIVLTRIAAIALVLSFWRDIAYLRARRT